MNCRYWLHRLCSCLRRRGAELWQHLSWSIPWLWGWRCCPSSSSSSVSLSASALPSPEKHTKHKLQPEIKQPENTNQQRNSRKRPCTSLQLVMWMKASCRSPWQALSASRASLSVKPATISWLILSESGHRRPYRDSTWRQTHNAASWNKIQICHKHTDFQMANHHFTRRKHE